MRATQRPARCNLGEGLNTDRTGKTGFPILPPKSKIEQAKHSTRVTGLDHVDIWK
jgi:hypothetical protein